MILGIKTLDNVQIRNKSVLVRIDINSDIKNNKLVSSERLTAPLETLRELQSKKAKVVLLAHQGRPSSLDFISLEQHAKCLKKFIKLKFMPEIISDKAINMIKKMKAGEIILLENVRFHKEELNYKFDKPNRLIKRLASLFDLYINDAFSASHREHASIMGFPRVLPSAIGRLFERELSAAQKLNLKDALFVLGGSKPEDNVKLVKNTNNRVLATGLFGPACLIALGKKLGKQNKIMKKEVKNITAIIKKNRHRIFLPNDLAIEMHGKRIDLSIDDFPVDKKVLDLGIKSIEMYANEIMKAKAVFFKGLAGLCNKPEFTVGTEILLRATMACKGFTIVCGGHTSAMIEKLKIPKKKFGYVSLGGGALIYYLAEGTLPAIEALKSSRVH